jgi:hypothetical protein
MADTFMVYERPGLTELANVTVKYIQLLLHRMPPI